MSLPCSPTLGHRGCIVVRRSLLTPSRLSFPRPIHSSSRPAQVSALAWAVPQPSPASCPALALAPAWLALPPPPAVAPRDVSPDKTPFQTASYRARTCTLPRR